MRLKDLAAHVFEAPALKAHAAQKAPESIPDPGQRSAGRRVSAKTAGPAPEAGRRPRAADLLSRANLASLGRDWLTQLQVNAQGALSSDAPEYVHQLRVGLRRLRCLCGILTDVDAARADRDHSAALAELRWIAGVLGEGRDLDVFSAELLPVAMAALPAPQAAALKQRAARLRSARRRSLRVALGSERFGLLIARCEAMLGAPAQADPDGHLADIGAVVAETMSRRSARARRWARRPDQETTETLHRLRFQIKKLRYLGEMIAPLHPAKQTRQYLQSVTELQSKLGRLQDIATARQLLSTLVGRRTGGLSARLPAMDAAVAESLPAALAEIMVAARKFRQTKPFWSDQALDGKRDGQ